MCWSLLPVNLSVCSEESLRDLRAESTEGNIYYEDIPHLAVRSEFVKITAHRRAELCSCNFVRTYPICVW